MGILPLSEAAEAVCPVLSDLLQAMDIIVPITRIAMKIVRISFPRTMVFLL
jgi:hypothetical protein